MARYWSRYESLIQYLDDSPFIMFSPMVPSCRALLKQAALVRASLLWDAVWGHLRVTVWARREYPVLPSVPTCRTLIKQDAPARVSLPWFSRIHRVSWLKKCPERALFQSCSSEWIGKTTASARWAHLVLSMRIRYHSLCSAAPQAARKDGRFMQYVICLLYTSPSPRD